MLYFRSNRKCFRSKIFFYSKLNQEEKELYNKIKNKLMKKYEKDEGINRNSKKIFLLFILEIEQQFKK